jgi:hypothetical protein
LNSGPDYVCTVDMICVPWLILSQGLVLGQMSDPSQASGGKAKAHYINDKKRLSSNGYVTSCQTELCPSPKLPSRTSQPKKRVRAGLLLSSEIGCVNCDQKERLSQDRVGRRRGLIWSRKWCSQETRHSSWICPHWATSVPSQCLLETNNQWCFLINATYSTVREPIACYRLLGKDFHVLKVSMKHS